MIRLNHLVDYHLHTKRCGHAVGEMAQYVERAIDIGLSEIGFADHLPLLHTMDRTLTMSWDDFPFYLADVERLRASYPEITVKLGVEVDYIKGRVGEIAAILNEYDFDFILGSVHFIDGWGVDDRRNMDNYELYDPVDLFKRYFSLLREAAASGLFDILAHPDLIKKYNFRPNIDATEIFAEAAGEIAAADIAIEVSSAGLRKPVGEIYPGPQFLKACSEAGVPVSLGSDAHRPDDVGRDFDKVIESLNYAGYDKFAVFSGRQRTLLPIAGDNLVD